MYNALDGAGKGSRRILIPRNSERLAIRATLFSIPNPEGAQDLGGVRSLPANSVKISVTAAARGRFPEEKDLPAVIILVATGYPATGNRTEVKRYRKPYHLQSRRRTQLRGLGNVFLSAGSKHSEAFVRFPRWCFTAWGFKHVEEKLGEGME